MLEEIALSREILPQSARVAASTQASEVFGNHAATASGTHHQRAVERSADRSRRDCMAEEG